MSSTAPMRKQIIDNSANNAAGFVPLLFSIPPDINLATATFRFVYDDSDPLADITVNNGVYQNTGGSLRLWMKNAGAQRNGQDLWVGANGPANSPRGDFIAANTEYSAQQLGFGGYTGKVYVKALRPSTSLGDNRANVRARIFDDSADYAAFEWLAVGR